MQAVVEIISACVIALASASFSHFGVKLERVEAPAPRAQAAVSRVAYRKGEAPVRAAVAPPAQNIPC